MWKYSRRYGYGRVVERCISFQSKISYDCQHKCIGKPHSSGIRCVRGLGVWFYSETGDVISLVLGLGDGGISNVVSTAIRSHHIIASNSALETPSAAEFKALRIKVFENIQKGGRWRNYQDPFGSVLGPGDGGSQTWCLLPWNIITSLQAMVWWDAYQQLSSLQSNMILLGLLRRD